MNESLPTNEPDELWEQQLERATSLEPLDVAELDGETVALHESWTRWTQLLDAADQERDEATFASRVSRPAPGVRWTLPAAAAALAVSLLAMIAAAWYAYRSPPDRSTVVESVAEDNVAPTPSDAVRQTQELTAQAADSTELAWDDSLDERLSTFAWALSDLRGSCHFGDSSHSIFLQQLEQMQSELNTESL